MILRNLLFFIAILLIIGWVLGVFVWPHPGYLIHTLAVFAIIALVLGLTRKVGKD
ncbi:MAG: lmo0937 family membrane protein [Chitinophagales bacterium]